MNVASSSTTRSGSAPSWGKRPSKDRDRKRRRRCPVVDQGRWRRGRCSRTRSLRRRSRQWSRMVSDLTGNHGKLKNCLAVCDVSGGMRGTALEACLAMGILVSDLSEEPWKGKVITFSENPQMHHIKGNTLKEKIDFMKRMEWGKGTNFQKVFDQILAIANKAKLGEEKMIKRVVVLSSMELDKAGANPWETDYEVIGRKYRERGYSGPPEMVFWNLKESQSTPVTAEEKGVAMVSGHSNNMLKLLMGGEEGKALAPMEVMEDAIGGPEYQQLVIFD